MLKEDVEIGMRVVPFQKTAYSEGLEYSIVWKDALNKNQEYLYVIDWDEEFNCFVLNDENINNENDGDFYNPEDFEIYNKQDIIYRYFNLLKSKGVTPEMYEKLWSFM